MVICKYIRRLSPREIQVQKPPVIIIACATPSDDIVIRSRDYYLFGVAPAVQNMLSA